MNFGPMNHEGGERRLNVAITRARREVIVFSTLTADQIDLARSRARGVRDLKRFLEYAERGPAAIAEAIPPTPDADVDSAFEEAVLAALRARGLIVHRQVGSARYRIDLAVVDPQAPGRYLLGIECDGPNYHHAKTARDRDKLRAGVLADLGWKLHRVWSTDWWTDPEREMQKIDQALAHARERTDASARGADRPAESSLPEHGTDTAPGTSATPAPPRRGIEAYPPVAPFASAGSPADFYEPSAVATIRARLLEVVRREGPISLPLAARRVAAAWSLPRVSARTVERIRRLIPAAEVRLQSQAGEFLWPIPIDPAGYATFRVPDANGRGARPVEDVPLEEIANAAVHILEHHLSAPLDELVRETARLFGCKRLGRVVDERIRKGIEGLVARGIARPEAGVIVLCRGKV